LINYNKNRAAKKIKKSRNHTNLLIEECTDDNGQNYDYNILFFMVYNILFFMVKDDNQLMELKNNTKINIDIIKINLFYNISYKMDTSNGKKSNKMFSGSGVIIIEDYVKKDGTIEPCIILARNKSSKIYNDFGGGIDSRYLKKHSLNESIILTAIKELREESRNLIMVRKDMLKTYIDINTGKKNTNDFYRGFFIKINGINRKYFVKNMKIIDKNKSIPKYWKETDSITHIPIKNIDFDKLEKRGKIHLIDIYGNDIPIHGRVKRLLYYGKPHITKVSKQKSYLTRHDMILNNTDGIDRSMNQTYSFKT